MHLPEWRHETLCTLLDLVITKYCLKFNMHPPERHLKRMIYDVIFMEKVCYKAALREPRQYLKVEYYDKVEEMREIIHNRCK